MLDRCLINSLWISAYDILPRLSPRRSAASLLLWSLASTSLSPKRIPRIMNQSFGMMTSSPIGGCFDWVSLNHLSARAWIYAWWKFGKGIVRKSLNSASPTHHIAVNLICSPIQSQEWWPRSSPLLHGDLRCLTKQGKLAWWNWQSKSKKLNMLNWDRKPS